jgi:hypothetical protein
MWRLLWKLGASSSWHPRGLSRDCSVFIGSLKRVNCRFPDSARGGLILHMFLLWSYPVTCQVVCGRLTPVKETRHPSYRRLGRTRGRSRRVQKITHLPGFDLRTVQPVASRYTDYAILAACICGVRLNYCTVDCNSMWNITYLMLYPCAWFWTLLMSAVSSVPDVSVMFTVLNSDSTKLFIQKL